MKDYRAELFEILRDKILNTGKEVHLFFIDHNNYNYLNGVMKINDRAYIYADDQLKKIFNSINKETILSNLNPQYRVGWENTYNRVKKEISTGSKLIRLNWATTAIFGPYFNPRRSAQSYNVYITLCFSMNEINELIDENKISAFEHTKINDNVFYNIDAVARSLRKNISKEIINNPQVIEQSSIGRKKEIKIDSIDAFSRIKRLKIQNFLNFNDINIDFAPGINLFIGENNIGKTGLLKFLYANSKSFEEFSQQKGTSFGRPFKELISIKIQKTFQSEEKIGTIVCKKGDKELKSSLMFSIADMMQEQNIDLSFKKATKIEIPNIVFDDVTDEDTLSNYNVVFVPAKEILSISNAIKVVKNYKIDGFDATYEDLLNDIEPLFAKKPDKDIFNQIASDIEKNIISGEIEYDKDRSKYFYKDNTGCKFDLTMAAEGVKQIGIIPLLIKTGKITEGTILFLDEPDNNLNPLAIRKLVYTLFELINAGVQIFITTHNHLFSQYISLLNEYKNVEGLNTPECKFYSLYKDTNDKTSIEIGNDLLDIQHNLILDEHIKMNDKEQELISKSENF